MSHRARTCGWSAGLKSVLEGVVTPWKKQSPEQFNKTDNFVDAALQLAGTHRSLAVAVQVRPTL